MNDTWIKIKIQKLEAFTRHRNAVNENIKFIREVTKDNSWHFLDCVVSLCKDGKLSIEVYRKPTYTDQYILLDSHDPGEQKLGIVRTQQDWAKKVPSSKEEKQKELHISRQQSTHAAT